jgi:head-tail adaptor
MFVEFQEPQEALDGLGAPMRTWTRVGSSHVGVENENITTTDSQSRGPREESIRSMTLVVRLFASFKLHTRMRVMDLRSGELFEISAVRYSAKRDQAFVDVVGGQSDG